MNSNSPLSLEILAKELCQNENTEVKLTTPSSGFGAWLARFSDKMNLCYAIYQK